MVSDNPTDGKVRSILDIARDYVAAGISLAPVKRDGTKVAAVPWKPYQERLPNDAELRRWFGGPRPSGIAIIGGAVSGALEILDFDREAGVVFPAWRQLVEAECPGLVDRLSVVETPDNGFHVRYRCPDEEIPGNAKLALDPDAPPDDRVLIETRGDKGYALVPGSPLDCHETGRPYRLLIGPHIPPAITPDERDVLWTYARSFNREVKELPRMTGQDLRPGEDFDRRGPDWSQILEPHGWRCVFGSPAGERRWRRPGKDLGWSATTGVCKGKDGSDLFRVFTNNAAPLEDGPGYGKFRTYALLNHGGNLSTAADDLARQGYGSRGASNGHKDNGRAERPAHRENAPAKNRIAAPRRIPDYQPFPIDALPPIAKNYVRQGAAALGCDPSFVALPVLSVLASAIGNTRVIRLKRGWTEPAILWTAIVGDSGTLKSPAYFLGVGHLFAIQEQLIAQYKRDCAAYQDVLAEWKEKKKEHDKWQKSNDEGVAPEDPGDEPDKPALQRVIVCDTTIEKLGEILEDNPRGTLVARDELSGWIGSFTKYKGKQGGSDVPNWLELNRAGTVIIDRKTGERRTLFIKRASASVTGGIQPGILARALTADLLDSGLAARLLLCWPPRLPKKWTEAEIDPDIERAFHQLLDRLLALDFGEKDGAKAQHILRLSNEAKALWVDFYNGWANAQAEVDGEMAAAYSKLEGYAARFALIYHVVRHAADDLSDSEPIQPEAIQAGITLAKWFAGEAHRVYCTLSESTEEKEMRQLVDFIRGHDGEVTAKQLQKSNGRKYPTAVAAIAALGRLAAVGIAEWRERPAGPKGGRPTRILVLKTMSDETDETSESG